MAEKKDYSMARLALKTYNRKQKFCQLRRTAHEPCINYERELQFIDDCLATIPERDSEVLKAFYIKNMPRIEISEMFHVEHSHIYRMKAKAEERFGELYNTRGRR